MIIKGPWKPKLKPIETHTYPNYPESRGSFIIAGVLLAVFLMAWVIL